MPNRVTSAPRVSIPNPYAGMPDWLQQLLLTASTSPVTTAIPTKSISELLGHVFTPTAKGTGLPKRIQLSSIDPDQNLARLHALDRGWSPVDSSMTDLAKLIGEGQIQPEGPPMLSLTGAINALRRSLTQQK